jgi:hypothetical protein
MAHYSQSTVPDTPEDRLEILMELARQASPEDRLRIERTIRVVLEARQTAASARLNEQKAEVRLRRSMATLQRVNAEMARRKAGLQIIRNNLLK